jgi:MFS transporter, ACS family, hexuronate transporter
MIALIAAATTINYIDRQSISLLFPVLSRPDQLNISPLQYARIGTILLFAYAVSQTVSGRLYDRFGTRAGFIFSVIVWSLAAMGHSLITGFATFAVMSFALGFGEAGNWPGAAKAIAEWFPVKERALAMAIFNTGASLGSVLAPPLVIGFELSFGWRKAFVAVGSLGFLWLAAWLALYRTPAESPYLRASERNYIYVGQKPRDPAQADRPGVFQLLRFRQVWAILLARLFVDPVWWLFVLWLPEYLSKARGMSLKQIGAFAWMPYLCASAGSLFGGWMAGRLLQRGWTVNRARRTVVIAAACLMPAGILAAFASSAATALACIGVVLFGFQMWISNVQTLPSDLFDDATVGSVAGFGGTAAAVGSMAFILSTGWIVSRYSYTPVLIAAGLLAPVGTTLLWFLAGDISIPAERASSLLKRQPQPKL